MYKKIISIMLTIAMTFSLVACGSNNTNNTENTESAENKTDEKSTNKKDKITIAYQYGIQYAPVEIMQHQKMLEEKLPDVEIEYIIQPSGAAINEGVISGDIDVAYMGTGPFLIGYDKGVPYKMYSAISGISMGLITWDENINSLKDFKDNDKIAVVSIGSIQHILLSMAAEKELGDSKALDKYLVSMSHPDSLTALLSKTDIKAYLAAPPFYNKALKEEGFKEILSIPEMMGGDYNFIVGAVSNNFAENYPNELKALTEATNEAMDMVNNDLEKSAEILAEMEGTEKDEMLEYLEIEQGKYKNEITTVLEMAQFMEREGYISKAPESIEEILVSN